MTSGVVVYLPTDTGGKKRSASPKGAIQSDGTYLLQTDGKSGAPLGKYKVIIQPPAKDVVDMKNVGGAKIVPPEPNNTELKKYEDPKETPFEKEVVESASPGAYDIAILD